jgi:Ca-activated chloride channel family protein
MPAPRYAGGKTIALTTDLEGRWSRNWIQWNDLQNFWTRIFDWLRPGPSEQPIPLHEARVSLSASQPILDLFLYEEASADRQFRFSTVGKSGKSEGTLKKLAPGHYQAALLISAPGDYRIELTEERRGWRIVYPPVGYILPYDPGTEITRPDFNTDLLVQLAQVTGVLLTGRQWNGTRTAGRYAPAFLIYRLSPTVSNWTLGFVSFNWFSKSRGAMISGDNPANSR